jgi:hypothetical protein
MMGFLAAGNNLEIALGRNQFRQEKAWEEAVESGRIS